MWLSSYLLRLLPVILPLIAICAALTGLALRTGLLPDMGNLELVVFGTLKSGILPVCFLVGAAFLVADILQLHRGKIILVVAAVIALATGVGCFFYGQCLYF